MITHTLSRRRVVTASLAGFATIGFMPARAQSRPISFIVPQPAGNPTDGIARKLQPLLQTFLGQNVIVENLPGASGSLRVNKALQSPPDAPALLIASQSEPILAPLALVSVRYKPEELRPLALAGRTTYVLAARADLPAANIGELIELAKRSNAKPLSLGHNGHGSMMHLLGEKWASLSGVPINSVPYRGMPPIAQDLMGGQIDLAFLPLGGSVVQLVESGKVRSYGITDSVAMARLPKLLPLAQQNRALADFVHGTWGAVLVSRTVPEATVQRLHKALISALADPDVRQYLVGSGLEPLPEPLNLTQLEAFYQGETRLYQKLFREIALKPI